MKLAHAKENKHESSTITILRLVAATCYASNLFLAKIGLNRANVCYFCTCKFDDEKHFLFKCYATQYFWEFVSFRLNVNFKCCTTRDLVTGYLNCCISPH